MGTEYSGGNKWSKEIPRIPGMYYVDYPGSGENVEVAMVTPNYQVFGLGSEPIDLWKPPFSGTFFGPRVPSVSEAKFFSDLMDDTPISFEFLEEMGFVWTKQYVNNDNRKMLYHQKLGIRYETNIQSPVIHGPPQAFYNFSLGTRYTVNLKTCGEIRRLFWALGEL